MNRRSFALAAALLLACSGKVTSDIADGGGGAPGDANAAGADVAGGGGPDASNGGGPEAGPGTDGATAIDSGSGAPDSSFVDASLPVTCNPGGGGGSGGMNSCQILASETCSDGNTYNVSCDCPSATCDCGATTVHFSGCPTCPTADQAWTLCGLPH